MSNDEMNKFCKSFSAYVKRRMSESSNEGGSLGFRNKVVMVLESKDAEKLFEVLCEAGSRFAEGEK